MCYIEDALIKNLPKLKAQAFNLTKNKDDADDLVSEACLKILSKKDFFKNNINLTGWFSTILRNIFINNYRENIRHQNIVTDFDPSQLKDKLIYSEDADSELLYNELKQQFDKNILGYKCFIAFINGYQYEQIAEMFELPVGTIKSRIFLYRKRLRCKLKNIPYNQRKKI